jgi:hypothetical protein
MINEITIHLTEVNMTYTEHFINSFDYSTIFLIASIKALIHAIIPSQYKTSSSDLLNMSNHGGCIDK